MSRPEEGSSAKISMLVVHGKPLGFDLLLAISAIKALGGMVVGPTGLGQLGNKEIVKCAVISINEPDFNATFNQAWTVAWKCSEGRAPEALDDRVAEYPVVAEIREDYEQELGTWMSNGWLVPYKEEELGPPTKGLIPLMAVLQQHNSKVRPVMNFQQLNCHVDVFRANADVCTAKLHEWQQKGANVSLLDLNRAYLQVHVQKTLWSFQNVQIGGQRYCLTLLGFGLNVAPLIIKAIVSTVLSQEETVDHAVLADIDDTFVNEDVMPTTHVRESVRTQNDWKMVHECWGWQLRWNTVNWGGTRKHGSRRSW